MLDFILTDGRAEVSQQTQDLLQATLDSYGAGITIYEVNLVNAEFPREVEVAVQDSIRAREDRERRILEAQTYSNDILPRARGEAERRRQDAEAYREQVIADAEGESDRFTQILAEYQKAPGVTRERLYIETLEEILRTSTKVLVDTEGGNNMLYLPLDQLSSAARMRRPPSPASSSVAPPPTSNAPRSRDARRRAVSENHSMSPRMNLLLILGVLAAIVVRMSVFTVDAREHAVKFRIGRDRSSGLRAGSAFQDSVLRERRSLSESHADLRRGLTRAFPDRREEEPDRRLLRELGGSSIRLSTTARSARDEDTAELRLSAIVKEGIRAAISRRTLQEVVSAERTELMEDMLVQVQERSPELGIEVVGRTRQAHRSRRRSQRVGVQPHESGAVGVATQLRAEGEEEYVRVRADAERQRTVILAEAYRDAERIRGAGDARAAEIYAAAYSQDRDFYSFYRSMQAYRESIGSDQDVLVLQPDSEFFKFLQSQVGSTGELSRARSQR